MSLPITIDTAFVRQYASAFEQVFQQTQSLLEGTVRKESQSAEMKFWDFVGETSGQWDLPRNSDTPDIPTPYSRRKCVLHRWNWGEYIDNFDKIQMLKDPQSDVIQAAVKAANRAKDERILEAIAAIVYTGKDGTTAVNSYDVGECRLIEGSGVEVTAGSNFSDTVETGLTLVKIATVGKIMDDAGVPESDRHFVANTDQKWYLLGSTKATSADYNGVRALVHGEMNSYLGFNFHWLPSARFTASTTDTGCYECAAYHKSAMMLSMGKEITTTVDVIPTKKNSVLAQCEMYIGAVRLQGPGVVRILLKKSPTLAFDQA